MLHYLLIFLEVIGCTAAGGLFLRGAGGLWSAWLGKDLGDTGPRIAWGLVGLTLPVGLLWPPVGVWGWLGLLVSGVTLGVMRGAGWGNSMALGWSGPGGEPTAATPRLSRVFAEHAFLMVLPAPLYLATRAADASSLPDAVRILLAIGGGVGGAALLALTWLDLYRLAWRFPRAWPIFGCTKADPPPFGEILTGATTAFCVSVSAFIFSLVT